MNKREKKRFVRMLIQNIESSILHRADEWPPEWDGIELRWLLRDHFGKCVMVGTGNRRRKMAYNNEVLVKNLV